MQPNATSNHSHNVKWRTCINYHLRMFIKVGTRKTETKTKQNIQGEYNYNSRSHGRPMELPTATTQKDNRPASGSGVTSEHKF